jgi:hypothetical protein
MSESEQDRNNRLVVAWAKLPPEEKVVRNVLAAACGKDPIDFAKDPVHTTALYNGEGVFGFALAVDGLSPPLLSVTLHKGNVASVVLVFAEASHCLTTFLGLGNERREFLNYAEDFLRARGLLVKSPVD